MAEISKQSVSDVNVDKIFIVADQSLAVDIWDQAIEVNIYQDLYEPFLTCDVTIEDGLDIYNELARSPSRQPGFTGHDLLVISYTSTFPGDNIPSKTHAFVLYEVEDRFRTKEKSELVSLQGISIEGWLSVDKKISRAYGYNTKNNKKTISHYVKSVVDEFIYNKQAKDIYDRIAESAMKVRVVRNNTYAETKSRLPYIVPFLAPIDAIDKLMDEADNDLDTPLFTFYEDSTGFHFADISKLVDADFDSLNNTFTYEPSNAVEGGRSQDFIDLKKVLSFEVIKQTDTMIAKLGGLFKSKTINIDVLKKNKTEIIYNYDKSGQIFSKLNDGNLPHGHLVSGTSSPDASVYMRTSRVGHDYYKLFESEHHLPKKSNTLLGKRQSYGEHLENIMLSVTLNGHSELDVGNKINLVIPKATTIGNKREANIDKYLSGYYLITRLRHIIKDNNMDTVIEVMKDTESTAPITQPHKG